MTRGTAGGVQVLVLDADTIAIAAENDRVPIEVEARATRVERLLGFGAALQKVCGEVGADPLGRAAVLVKLIRRGDAHLPIGAALRSARLVRRAALLLVEIARLPIRTALVTAQPERRTAFGRILALRARLPFWAALAIATLPVSTTTR
jgi:hypothetical protein